jgi:hypothetical protein
MAATHVGCMYTAAFGGGAHKVFLQPIWTRMRIRM